MMDEKDTKSSEAKHFKEQLHKPELIEAVRTQYRSAKLDERFLALLVRLEHAEEPKEDGSGHSSNKFWGLRDLPFPYVTVSMDAANTTRNISSVAEAAEWLVLYWPIEEGEKLRAARQACFDALEGKITCTMARNAFIDATREAGIYITQQRL